MNTFSSGSSRNVIIVAASCLIGFLNFGIARLSGLLFVACRERFNTGREEASLPFILCFTGRTLSGPFVGYLGNKFGLRCVTILGCLLSAVAIGACFLVEDIIPFTVLWGGGFGLGFGIGTILIDNILHLYFKTSYNRILGIYFSSGCLGSFVLPGITETLLKTYGTSGTFLILSGLILHCVPAAMLLTEPELVHKIKRNSEIKEMDNTVRISGEVNATSIENMYNSDCKYRELTTASNKSTFDDATNDDIIKFDDIPDDLTIRKPNRVDIYCISSHTTDVPNLLEKNVLKKVEDVTAITTEIDRNKEQKRSIIKKDTESGQEISDSKKHFEGKENSNSIAKLPLQSKTISRNLQIFLHPVYILILLSVGLSAVVAVTPYTIIVDVCRDKGITEDVTVLMTFAIADMFGRLIFGYVADGGVISPLSISALCSGCCGLLLIGFTWLKEFYTVLIFLAVIGAFMGGTVAMSAGITRDYVEKENLTMALSSRLLLFGLLMLSQSPVIGYFRETLHSYDGLLYLFAAMCLLSTIIALFIPLAARLRDRRKNKTIDTEKNICL